MPERAVHAGCEHVASRRSRSHAGGVGLVEALRVLGLVLVGVLDLDAVAVEHAVARRAGRARRRGCTPGRSRRARPRSAPASSTPLNEIVNVGDAAVVGDRALVDRALDAQAAAGLAAVLDADLVDVAVVVDRRREELGDDHAAADEHEHEHARSERQLRRRGPRRGRRRRVGAVARAQVHGLSSSAAAAAPAGGRGG